MMDVKEKHCPFRKYKRAEKPTALAAFATFSEGFHRCMGEKCAAYYNGACLRLMPAVTEIRVPPLTDAEIEELREELRKAPAFSAPEEPPEPWPSCPTCANHETKAGCSDCILNADNRFRKETLQMNWEPKELPW